MSGLVESGLNDEVGDDMLSISLLCIHGLASFGAGSDMAMAGPETTVQTQQHLEDVFLLLCMLSHFLLSDSLRPPGL